MKIEITMQEFIDLIPFGEESLDKDKIIRRDVMLKGRTQKVAYYDVNGVMLKHRAVMLEPIRYLVRYKNILALLPDEDRVFAKLSGKKEDIVLTIAGD